MSLTYHVSRWGEAQWWLTRESGSLPGSIGGSCTRCTSQQQPGDLRKAYLVIVAEHPGKRVWTEPLRRVAFAEMKVGALTIVVDRIAPVVLGQSPGERLRVLRALFILFGKGLFSSSLECECSLQDGVCTLCGIQRQPRFVWENGYSRLSPFGRDHWYRGVTDAVDKEPHIRQWLQCCKVG
jgi:hypothetical protein